jgi:hypothetical protein
MRKIESSLRREIESYLRAGYTQEGAIAAIKGSSRRGMGKVLDALAQPLASRRA